ncbi:MAG TPA: DUF4167 domain-containing protein [Bosea sp. (in: a-proteobacteria)]|jgi:hypothetical protein|uniref:DUF4167 domain-containing protein n=1 Tax=Bosea sp. (in: a-proteobacteria) TaxID=1871050 RepID=UPI002E10E97A|nr:DUF4167 domain-containing protein [Bosea sp. (in: a-proteobacteria)]
MNDRRPRTLMSRPATRPLRGNLSPVALRQAYERCLTLAQAAALAGDRIEAERHYQQAEHYLRSLAEERAA